MLCRGKIKELFRHNQRKAQNLTYIKQKTTTIFHKSVVAFPKT